MQSKWNYFLEYILGNKTRFEGKKDLLFSVKSEFLYSKSAILLVKIISSFFK